MRARPLAACTAVLALAFAGCAGQYGAIRWDSRVQREFETAEILPGHRYFTAGSDTIPDAILALREDRPLRTELWRDVAMTPEILARLVDRMRGVRIEGPFGGVVVDREGARIGAWYSLMKPPVVKLLDDGGVIINLPTMKMTGEEESVGGRGR